MNKKQRQELIAMTSKSTEEFYKRMCDLDDEYLHHDPSVNRAAAIGFIVLCAVDLVVSAIAWFIKH